MDASLGSAFVCTLSPYVAKKKSINKLKNKNKIKNAKIVLVYTRYVLIYTWYYIN